MSKPDVLSLDTIPKEVQNLRILNLRAFEFEKYIRKSRDFKIFMTVFIKMGYTYIEKYQDVYNLYFNFNVFNDY